MRPSRDDIRNANPHRTCPVCQNTFTPVRRQRYCTPACRQAAWRTRHPEPVSPAPEPSITAAPPSTRRDNTIYQCQDCDGRYLGRQWCHDCNKPCIRLGTGGSCPHCDEPVTITDLIG